MGLLERHERLIYNDLDFIKAESILLLELVLFCRNDKTNYTLTMAALMILYIQNSKDENLYKALGYRGILDHWWEEIEGKVKFLERKINRMHFH